MVYSLWTISLMNFHFGFYEIEIDVIWFQADSIIIMLLQH